MSQLDFEASIDAKMLDILGLPGFFATEFVSMPIGDGCVRLFGGVMQNRVFVPQYFVNSPHQCILRGAAAALDTAKIVSLQSGWKDGGADH